MGRHHARTIAACSRSELVAAVDLVPERAASVAELHGCRVSTEVPHDVDAVVVATPTSTHVDVAGPLLDAGMWCLVEKPLAPTAAAAAALPRERLVVGHSERFNPALRSVGALSPSWVEARRCAPPTGRSEDVDVVLDLMIHDLDLVLGWTRGTVDWLDVAGVRVLGDRVDAVSVRLRTSDGMTASLTASRVARDKERVLRVYEPGRYTEVDLLNGVARRAGRPIPKPDERDALTAQWDAFGERLRGKASVSAGRKAGIEALELAERIRARLPR